jgi:hypothetical protein
MSGAELAFKSSCMDERMRKLMCKRLQICKALV